MYYVNILRETLDRNGNMENYYTRKQNIPPMQSDCSPANWKRLQFTNKYICTKMSMQVATKAEYDIV